MRTLAFCIWLDYTQIVLERYLPSVKKCQFILHIKFLGQRTIILFIIEIAVDRVSAFLVPVIEAPSSTG